MEKSIEIITYDRGAFSAQVVARASADADASFQLRRGVRADAHAEAAAELDAKLGATAEGLHAQMLLRAQVAASARAALVGQLDVHGLFAEASLGAEVRAQLRGDVSLTAGELLDGLQRDLPPFLVRPAAALLQHTELHAGVFADVYLAFKGMARLQAGRSLIPIDGTSAGFTVNFQYGYAYAYGAGVHGNVDFEFPDAAAVVDAVVTELVQQLDDAMPKDAPPQVMTLLRLLLPLAGSAAVAVGRALGAPRTTSDPVSADLGGIASAFLRELRTHGLGLALTTVIRSAAEEAVAALTSAAGVPFDHRLLTLGGQLLDQAAASLGRLRAGASPADVLPPVIEVCGLLAELGDVTATDPLAGLVEAATAIGAGVALLLDLLGHPVPALPDSLASRIGNRLHPRNLADPAPADPAPVTLMVLAEYLGTVSGVIGADAARLIDEVAQTLGRTPEALIHWLWQLGSDNADAAPTWQAAADAVHGLAARVTDELTPFVDQLPDGDLKQLAAFIRPLLEIVELALPALMTAGADLTPPQAARTRDQLDTQMTQLFGSLTVRILERVIRPYFGRGADQLRELADRVDQADPAFAEFFALANRYSVLFRIDEIIVAAALRETAGMLSLIESSGFDSAVKLLESFVLLPEENTERRAQLAVLAGSDEARIGNAALWSQLVEAMFVDSHELALGMVPPSLRMSAIILAQQGPVPLLTLFEDAKRIGQGMADAIGDLSAAGVDLAHVVDDLVNRGRLDAEALRALSEDFKGLVRALAEVVHTVLDMLREMLWPAFVASTGGLGLVFRSQFDDLFDGASWIVDQVRDALGRIADDITSVVISVAQGFGALDAGSGDDLGQLGQAIRQSALGQPDEAAVTVRLGPGSASVTRAELASVATNAVFARGDLRDRIRKLHGRAGDQATLAARVANLRAGQRSVAANLADLQQLATAKSLPTGTLIDLRIAGLDTGQALVQEHVFSLTLPTQQVALVTGGSTVRLEVGGTSVAIDPRLWQPDGHGNLACRVKLVCEPPTPGVGVVPAQMRDIRAVELRNRRWAGVSTAAVPSVFRPRNAVAASSEPTRTEDFLPWELTSADPAFNEPRPTVLAVDRTALRARGETRAAALRAAQQPAVTDFTSSTEIGTVFSSPPGRVADLRPRDDPFDPGGGGDDDIPDHKGDRTPVGAGGHADGPAPAGPAPAPPSGVPFAAVAVVPPGFVTVVACATAVPGPGQDRSTTPSSIASTWCVMSTASN